MKLSNETLNVLANFASMNPNLEFKKGKDIKTISSTKAVLAKAVLKDDFPQDFCVHDLNQFLMTYNHSKDTEIKFEDKNIIVEYNPRSKVEFRMSEKSTILVPPDKELSLPSIDVKTTIKEEDFKDFLKISSMLKSPHMAIESDGDTVFLISYDAKDNSAHKQSIKIDDGNGKKFRIAFLIENIRFIAGTYDVEVSSKGLALFKNKNQAIQYFVAAEAKFSNFGQ